MSDPILIPGGRDVRGRLDRGTDAEPTSVDRGTDAEPTSVDSPDTDSVVVACPPHPQHGGSRSDPRLRAVSDGLAPDVACLRFDYGEWDEGEGETADAEHAIAWAADRFDSVGLFGYSFGGGVALRAAARADTTVAACSVLAPAADPDMLDTVACPLQLLVGERDTTVDWEPVADRATVLGHAVERLPATHQFRGDLGRVGELVGRYLSARL
ncbi:dienelactone hydrolase family protein [Halomicroarcula sp. F28]|uniref:alpha/beta hydrolase n=1 Tax=Haloarcula salinisoli TaxID=2487746 RepID=UPI001C739A7B|nr:alpha/beta fold hydrolase [Halomicroarcula salinisoli]MBX0287555.1 dienelactone hydrolase family protein [Halomicroarcula salinisoli]